MASAPTCGPQTFLDHGRSAHVDRWDGERAITVEQRNLDFLNALVNRICKVLVGAEKFALEMFSKLKDPRYRSLPEELIFLHAEEILEMYPELPRKQRETAPAEESGYLYCRDRLAAKGRLPHEMRAADHHWVTDTSKETGSPRTGVER